MTRELLEDRPDVLAVRGDEQTRCRVTCRYDGADWRTAYTVRAEGPWGAAEASAADAFAAVSAVRSQLEPDGWLLCVAGSRRDVWLSRMARDMGGGLKGYVLRPGERTDPKSLIGIFEDAPPGLVTTVDGQRSAFDEWTETLRS